MIKRQRTFTCKCRFKETFRKLFLNQVLLRYTRIWWAFVFYHCKGFMVEENGVKKSLSQNRQQLLVLLILQAITELTFQKAAEPVF